jgi:hypothetical protein
VEIRKIRAQNEPIAIFDYLVLPYLVFLPVRKPQDAEIFHAVVSPPTMIVMVMGQQDGFRLPAVLFDGGQYRGGFAGIDDEAATVIFTKPRCNCPEMREY